MTTLIWITLLMAVVSAAPSGHGGHLQHISVPNYNPKLEFLGQHVDLPEIPTKVIRITKTVAIKVPVPYPVNVPHHVPYPVTVNKPYPVPVTKIVKVPEPVPVPISSGGHGDSTGHGVSVGHDASSYGVLPQSYAGNGYNGGIQIQDGHGGYEGGYNQGYDNTLEHNNEQNDHGYDGSQQYSENNQIYAPATHNTAGYGQSQGIPAYHQQGGETNVQHQIASAPGHVSSISGEYTQNYHQGQQIGHY